MLVFLGETGPQVLIVTCQGYAEPRTGWRERGVVPSSRFHRTRWGADPQSCASGAQEREAARRPGEASLRSALVVDSHLDAIA